MSALKKKGLGHHFLLKTCLPTDSKLGLKDVNATVGLLYKLDFVIKS